MTIDKEKLKALAEEAGKTTGWYQVGSFGLSEVSGKAEQAFIAAATPETILALIAEIQHLQDLVSEWRRSSPVLPSRASAAIIDQLKADNDALRKDAERYRWLMSGAVYNGTLGIDDGWIDFEFKDEAQKAIDAAIAKEASHG